MNQCGSPCGLCLGEEGSGRATGTVETASSIQQLQLPIITPLPPPKGAVYWTVFFLYPVGFFLDLFPGYRVSNSTVGLGSFLFFFRVVSGV